MLKKIALSFGCLLIVANVTSAESNWTGAYLGVNAGGFWGTSNVTTSAENNALLNQPDTPEILYYFNQHNTGAVNFSQLITGVQGGYNLQLNSALLGLELDFDSLPINATRSVTELYLPTSEFSSAYIQQQTIKTNWLFTLRPRLGYTLNQALFYFTGGLAVSDLTEEYRFFDSTVNTPGNNSYVQNGWTLGGGVEYLLKGRWGEHWTVKVEYLYADLGQISTEAVMQAISPAQTLGVGDILSTSASLRINTVRAGVNYHF